jgi:hypothetical protein
MVLEGKLEVLRKRSNEISPLQSPTHPTPYDPQNLGHKGPIPGRQLMGAQQGSVP